MVPKPANAKSVGAAVRIAEQVDQHPMVGSPTTRGDTDLQHRCEQSSRADQEGDGECQDMRKPERATRAWRSRR